MTDITLDTFENFTADDPSAVVATLAQQAALPRPLDDGKLYAVLVDGNVRMLETPGYTDRHEDERADHPREIKRAVTVLDVPSFLDYLARNTYPAGVTLEAAELPLGTAHEVGANCAASPGSLELWADIDRRTVTAIIDGIFGWRRHTATLTLKHSREWAEWAAIDGKLLKQVEFAQFIEDHLSTIAHPDGAVLLDICQTLEAHTGVQFKMQNILANGQRQFRYEETIESRAGQKGDLTIPGELTLVLRPFQGSERIAIAARFRYRIADGVMFLGVKLAEPETAVEDAFNGIVEDVQSRCPVRVNHGRP